MKILFFLYFVAVSQALPGDEWEAFKKSHGKKYKTVAEEEHRRNVFHESKKFIENHNKKFKQGLVSFSLKMNHLGDLMNHEFRAMLNKYNHTKGTRPKLGSIFINPSDIIVSNYMDWRERGAVTPVKDQGHCGSCWAFSTTGSLEGQHFKKTRKLVSLSEQNLVDCSREYGNNGCDGGIMNDAFRYIAANGGIDTEDSYPYEGKEGKCRFNKSKVGAINSGFVQIPEGDEAALMKAVGIVGPVSVAINAGLDTFRFYSSGVYEDSECSADGLDHGVLTVGFGSENGRDFWLVKNSWNTKWGEEGYIRIAKDKKNMCGIASMASFPVI